MRSTHNEDLSARCRKASFAPRTPWLLKWTPALAAMLILVMTSGLFAQTGGPNPPTLIQAYQAAVERKDADAVYALLSSELRQGQSLEAFRARFELDYPLIAEESRRLSDPELIRLSAQVPLGATTVVVVWEGGGWKIANPEVVLTGANEGNIRAAVVECVLGKDVELVVQKFLSDEPPVPLTGRFWLLNRVIASYNKGNDTKGSTVDIPMDSGRTLTLIQTAKGWRLQDIDWLIVP